MLEELNKKRNNQSGFTLVELMIVIAVIGILVSFAMPKFANVTQKAHDAKTLADMNTIKNAAQLYIAERGGVAGKDLNIEKLVEEGYLDQGVLNLKGDEEKLDEKYKLKITEGEKGVDVKVENVESEAE